MSEQGYTRPGYLRPLPGPEGNSPGASDLNRSVVSFSTQEAQRTQFADDASVALLRHLAHNAPLRAWLIVLADRAALMLPSFSPGCGE